MKKGNYAIVNIENGKIRWAISEVRSDGAFSNCGAPFAKMKYWKTLNGVKQAFRKMLDGNSGKLAEKFQMVDMS